MWLTVILSLLMWGIAVGQNVGTTLSAFLPVIFVSIAPPGSGHIPLKIGAVTPGLCVITAIAAFMSPETYRTHLDDLGDPNAVPVPKSDYDRVRADRIAAAAQDA